MEATHSMYSVYTSTHVEQKLRDKCAGSTPQPSFFPELPQNPTKWSLPGAHIKFPVQFISSERTHLCAARGAHRYTGCTRAIPD
jgi:hypothetical protein